MKFKPINLKNINTYSIKDRKSKVGLDALGARHEKGVAFSGFLDSLPDVLGAANLKAVAAAVLKANVAGKTIALGMGAHVIKTGLSPLIIDLMERGVINSVAMNGAGIVHDFELAYNGSTSEDVDAELASGKFGMADETGSMINQAINKGVKKGLGLGRSVGKRILASRFPYKDLSILAAAARLDIPATVHVAVGTDIVHIHPQIDPALTGAGTHRDFLLFASVVESLEAGVFLNIGSAVIMPEIFLKALTVTRNMNKGRPRKFTTVNMDFIQHYRPVTNVVRRPTMTGGGRGYALTGHHEIMVPLLCAAIIEGLK